MTELELSHSLRTWPSGAITTPTDDALPTSVTLLQSVNGEASQRVFPVTASEYGRSSELTPNSRSWTQTLEAPADLDTVIDEELLFVDELPAGWGSITTGEVSPIPLTVNLGEWFDTPTCPIKPTYLEVAQRALAYIGLDLVVYAGPGLPFLDRRVKYDYTTRGKTVQAVLDETILTTTPRWWGDGMTVYVDGRELASGSLATVAGIESLTMRLQRGATPPEPSPPAEDPEPGGGTFETFDDGTYTSTESAGAGDEYTETTYTITKADGRVTSEREVRRAFVPTLAGPVWAVVYDSLTTREYHPACSEALVSELQIVNAARTDFTYWNLELDPGTSLFPPELVPVEDFVPPMYETLRKTVRQTWHAEGWLKTREEVTLEAGTYLIRATGEVFGEIAYKRSSRTEAYLPVGNGLWLHRVTEYLPVDAPVWVVPEGGLSSVQATYPLAGINSYTRTTDSPPPTVSCPTDDCRVEETPAERYAYELALREAVMVNDPDRVVYTLSLRHLALDWSVGDTVDDLLVTRITRNVSAEGLSCEAELWGAYESGS